MSLQVTVQDTPNPNARRFLLDRPVQEDAKGRFFTAPGDDPLAGALLAVDGVDSVLLLPTSVTVNKTNDVGWDVLVERVQKVLEEHLGD